MKYHYFTVDVNPDKLEEYLQKYGSDGWEFIQLVIMQRQVPAGFNLSGQQGIKIEIQFKLIFKKCEKCQE